MEKSRCLRSAPVDGAEKTKAFLNDHNVAYSYIDVDLLSADDLEPVRAEQTKFNPAGSFPTIVIGDEKCIIGYDEDKLLALVGE